VDSGGEVNADRGDALQLVRSSLPYILSEGTLDVFRRIVFPTRDEPKAKLGLGLIMGGLNLFEPEVGLIIIVILESVWSWASPLTRVYLLED
jgi:hypothetical protein